MEQIPPMNKMPDAASLRQKMDALKAKAAKEEYQKAEKAQENLKGQRTSTRSPGDNVDRQEIARQAAAREAGTQSPTYSEVNRTAEKKSGPTYTKEGKEGVFHNTCSQDIFARLIEDESRMRELTRGVQEKVSVIFADVRSFTYLASTMPPDRVFTLLNIFLNEMIGVVRDGNQGYIDKIIGDCIMAFFGLPYPQDCSRKAVVTAIEMQKRMPGVNEALGARGLPPISIGIGINTGFVRAGFTTTDKEISGFTVIGDTVNLASKYEGIAGRGEIVIGPGTLDEIRGEFETEEHELKVRITNEDGEYKAYRGYRVLWS